jgi:hypothetical protein
MIQSYFCAWGLCLSFIAFAITTGAQPIVIDGVTDESAGGPRSIRVRTENGFSYSALLNGVRIPTDVTNVVDKADYYELFVHRTNVATAAVTSQMVKFIVRAPDRGDTEDGLPAWVPWPVIPSATAEFAGAHLEVIAPETMPTGLEIPVIAWVKDDGGQAVRVNGFLSSAGHPSIKIRRGVGSGLLAGTHPAGPLAYPVQVGPLASNKVINVEAGTTWTSVSGNISGNIEWGPNARISVTGHINVPAGSTLTISSGTVVRLNSGMNITNFGRIVLQGSTAQPVVFTPVSRAQPWGGFWLNSSQLDGGGAIFIGSGSRTGFPGHRTEQPLFFLTNQCRVALTNCAAIDLAGQLHHSRAVTPFSTFTMVDSLVARLTTAGEFNNCSLTFIRSALIEMPYEDQFYCANPDCDHDGFYLNTGTHELRDSLIGWLKDDGIDSGSGGGPSVINVINCWFEAAYHEACAWSNARRSVTNLHLVTMNSGQGIEAGWSSGTAPTPYVLASNCLSLANASGVRFGDNYDWDYWGFLRVTNSFILNNHRDIYGREWDSWNYRTDAMDVQGNYVTAPNTNHPNNTVWNAAQDGWRLASFMTTPPDAPVGIGFATWPNQTNMSFIVTGVPVGLSSFSTNTITVNYTFESGGNTLETGALTFLPGEIVKRIQPTAFNVAGLNVVNVTLSDPVNGELSGASVWTFRGSYATPLMSARVAGTQRDMARLVEGMPLGLNLAAAHSPTIHYEYAGVSGTLASGTFNFPAGQTLAWLPAPSVNPEDHDFVRLRLRNPSGAVLIGTSNIYYVKGAANAPPAVPLISRGAVWYYLDTGVDQLTAWRALAFNDSGWEFGPAQLGFGETDQNTPITDNNQLTTYFRRKFVVEDPGDFANLSLWLLRDDAGVVFLNGTEVFRTTGLPPPPALITYTSLASTTFENQEDTGTVPSSRLVPGTNIAAVEIHQESAGSSDVSFDFELIANPVVPQAIYAANFGGELNIVWSDSSFVLEEAELVTGPWTQVDSGSPFLIVPSEGQRFYRLSKP